MADKGLALARGCGGRPFFFIASMAISPYEEKDSKKYICHVIILPSMLVI